MIIDILKNPVIIGLIAGIITFFYLSWTYKKKFKKDPNARRNIGFIMPIVIAVIAWFLSYSYFSNYTTTDSIAISQIPTPNAVPSQIENISIGGNAIISSDSATKSFTLAGKGITVPTKLPDAGFPDVFIETLDN